MFAYVNQAWISSWNQPVLSNEGKVSCSMKQRGALLELELTTDRHPPTTSRTHYLLRHAAPYAALRKSSDNQQQHLLLGQRWIIGNTMWKWLSTSSQRRILDLWNKVYQDFGKFNSLRNTLTDSRSNMSLSSCLLFTLMTMTCNFWYRHSQPLGRSQVYTELSSHVSVPYLVRFIFYLYTIQYYLTGITNKLAQIEN